MENSIHNNFQKYKIFKINPTKEMTDNYNENLEMQMKKKKTE